MLRGRDLSCARSPALADPCVISQAAHYLEETNRLATHQIGLSRREGLESAAA